METVTGRGYRFIASVDVLGNARDQPSPTRLAVLPFRILGTPFDLDYLADGLTEETIVSLGQIDAERLSVIGGTSTRRYKGTTKSLRVIGLELGVDYVVEASIRREGGLVRISATRSRVVDHVQIWSASYDRQPAGTLDVQQELSIAIAEQIRLRLSPERATALARRHTRNAEAYDLYLRGRRFWNQLTPQTTEVAIDYYTRATALDSGYALAWAGLAEAHASSPINGDASPMDAWPRAKEAAANAVRAPGLIPCLAICCRSAAGTRKHGRGCNRPAR